MTDEIQEYKNALFSHYLLQDHDEERQDTTYKGSVTPRGIYALDGLNILGHRHPLYLRSLVDCLELPTELSQTKAMELIEPTLLFIKDRLGVHDHKHIALIQTRDLSDFWRNHKFSQDLSQDSFMIGLSLNTCLLFSKHEITRPTAYLPTLALIYQNKITHLFKEQGFLNEGGRVDLLNQNLLQESRKINLESANLKVELNKKISSKNIHYLKDLIFPISITDKQIEHIFKLLKEAL